MEAGQATGQGTETADRGDIEAEAHADQRQHHDRHQLRRHNAREPRQSVNDQQPQEHQSPNNGNLPAMGEQGRSPMIGLSSVKIQTELGQLRLKNQQCQGIDEATEHTLRHKTHLIGQPHVAPEDLKHTGHQTSHHQILHAQAGSTGLTRGHKSRHQEGRGSRRGRDHGHAPSHHSDGEGQAERPEQTHLGIHTGNAGEGNGFGNHREGHHQTGQQVFARVREPLVHQGRAGALGHRKDAAGSADRRSEGWQVAFRVQSCLERTKARQPCTKGLLEFLMMEGQMIVDLGEMNPRAHRIQQLPHLFEPGEALLAGIQIPCRPNRRDPGFPDGISMDKRRRLHRNAAGGSSKLLTGHIAAGMGTLGHQRLQPGHQRTPFFGTGPAQQADHLPMQPGGPRR